VKDWKKMIMSRKTIAELLIIYDLQCSIKQTQLIWKLANKPIIKLIIKSE
jgi:hypothetical protein